jgi:hypothetical protein
MCSTVSSQLARLCLAIEELADDSADGDDAAAGSRQGLDGVATESRNADSTATDGGTTDSSVAARLAALWAMVAAADPELARRLPGYLSAAD